MLLDFNQFAQQTVRVHAGIKSKDGEQNSDAQNGPMSPMNNE